MALHLIRMILRNLTRSRTRTMIAATGCALAAFVTCFFLASEDSLKRLAKSADADANLVVRQKDRY